MDIKFKKVSTISEYQAIVFIISDIRAVKKLPLIDAEQKYVLKRKEKEDNLILINRFDELVFVHFYEEKTEHYKLLEKSRCAGNSVQLTLNKHSISSVVIKDYSKIPGLATAFAEGIFLGNYCFDIYKTDKKPSALSEIGICSDNCTAKDIALTQIVCESTVFARNLVNEPVNSLNAVALSNRIVKAAKVAGIKTEVFNKTKILSLKMGGLLAVNLGSIDPPTFTVMEWKPEKPINAQPLVLVGKGIVYDTGGANLKPGPSMEGMKSDMSGAAAVAGAMLSIAKAKLPVHTIALIPATDNRMNGNAYVSGDIIKMHSGKTVEVLNTDAEGRMILADALSYAKKYKPMLVIDVATLTGSAAATLGRIGIAAMGNQEQWIQELKKSGNTVYERIAEFPFWEEYGDMIKSDIADIKNIGGKYAGAITAGKFLEHFTDYDWVHLDIAGPAFLDSRDSYRGTGGTGVCVRLLYHFVNGLQEKQKVKSSKNKK